MFGRIASEGRAISDFCESFAQFHVPTRRIRADSICRAGLRANSVAEKIQMYCFEKIAFKVLKCISQNEWRLVKVFEDILIMSASGQPDRQEKAP